MPQRRIKHGEAIALNVALQQGTKVEDLLTQYGQGAVDTFQRETGLRLPGSGASAISDAERDLYMQTITNNQDLWSAIGARGISGTDAVQRLNEAQLYVPLTQDHQGIYDWAVANKLNAEELSTISGAPLEAVNTVLAGAGLSLPGGTKKGTTTPMPGTDADYPGGLPRNQGDGGMYGAASRAESPVNILGFIPRSPSLRMVRRTAKRQNDPNWRGQTDTILTSGQGVTDPASTQVKTLMGS